MNTKLTILKASKIIIISGFLILLANLLTQVMPVSARTNEAPPFQASPIHPSFPFLDADGKNVLATGNPVSTMNTCGGCHDTAFIEAHSFHADAGLQDFNENGDFSSGQIWDSSTGIFGKWNPIQYRYLSSYTDEIIDLGTPEWLMTIGVRHVGGGPAVYSKNGSHLTELKITPGDPQTHIFDYSTGDLLQWDWNESGVVEMNCFLCHTDEPDNEARIDSLHSGNFGWANTATLLGSGLVEKKGDQYTWNKNAFSEEGEVNTELLNIQDPTNQNCGLCHGLVHDDVDDPLVMTGCSPERWRTITTGQIISQQQLSDTGMNLANKESLNRSWDIHAERLLKCTDCHYSLNNPLYYQESEESKPEHLIYDPRRVEIGDYLEKPLHQFARGNSPQSTIAENLENTMRNCRDCHDYDKSHQWLPYSDRHNEALSCESCHIPKIYSSSNQTHDWTVIHTDGTARIECRGVEGDQDSIRGLLVGYDPVWLQKTTEAGVETFFPFNLITSFFWIHGDPPTPVPLDLLKAAYLEDGDYHPGVILRFDSNNDSFLSDDELKIDSEEKEQFLTDRLTLLGLKNPRITGEVRPYSINHNVANGEWTIKDCTVCHSEESRITQEIQLASMVPGNAQPSFITDKNLNFDGEIITTDDGKLFFKPNSNEKNIYILGMDNIKWVDLIGLLAVFCTIGGIGVHGGLRILSARKNQEIKKSIKKVYMYGVYERLWHWLQTFAIVLLIITGLVIHKPDIFGFLSFSGVVHVHNIIAVILGLNALFSLFYHVASGEIKQYIPRPRGFFDQSITQAIFYIRGIFKGDEHPFEKTPEKKLNPLQQITYFAILNVLLPVQGITGILIWGAQRWPNISDALGGLRFLAPFHTFIAWLFMAFIILHVYLTTTGYKPITGIKAMIFGWEDVEDHHS